MVEYYFVLLKNQIVKLYIILHFYKYKLSLYIMELAVYVNKIGFNLYFAIGVNNSLVFK